MAPYAEVLKGRLIREKGRLIREKVRMTFARFVQNELTISNTFAKIVLAEENNPETIERSLSNAKKAYESALRFSRKFELPPPDAQNFAEKLCQLRSTLQLLGVTDFSS